MKLRAKKEMQMKGNRKEIEGEMKICLPPASLQMYLLYHRNTQRYHICQTAQINEALKDSDLMKQNHFKLGREMRSN